MRRKEVSKLMNLLKAWRPNRSTPVRRRLQRPNRVLEQRTVPLRERAHAFEDNDQHSRGGRSRPIGHCIEKALHSWYGELTQAHLANGINVIPGSVQAARCGLS
jgi:hypothetical protein